MAKKLEENTINAAHEWDIITHTREIFLHGRGDDETVNGDTAITFLKNLRILESQGHSSILIHQYGTGGAVESGFMMYEAIRHCSSPIIFILYGACCSMSTVIPLAADLVISMPSTYFLLHEGNSSINQDHTFKQSKAWFDYDTKIVDQILDIYSQACFNSTKFNNKTIQQVKRYISNRINEKSEWIISAEEAVKFGLVSGIFGQPGYEDLKTIREIYDK
jgi:ATP-dependent protease ClpP protease subunit